MESTLVIIKPDAVKAGLLGRIIAIYEDNGLLIDALYSEVPSFEKLARHYAEHIGKPFYESLLTFMSSGTVVAIKASGPHAVELVRELNGTTNPKEARPGTVRYLYGTNVQRNAVHGSADQAAAANELAIWFG